MIGLTVLRSWKIPLPSGPSVEWDVGATPVQVHGATFLFVADAAVGNRQLTMQINDANGSLRMIAVAPIFQTASTDVNYCFFRGLDGQGQINGSIGQVQCAWPEEMILQAGDVLTISDAAAVSETDSLTDVVLQIEVLV